jgi:diguanylate cyclase (GGDEF)-like protein
VKDYCDLFRTLGNSLDLEEMLSSFDRELRRLVVYAAISVHVVENGRVIPVYTAGDEFRALADLEGPVGEGFLGNAAAKHCPALNCRPDTLGRLETALVIPLDHSGTVTAVVALYDSQGRVFSEEDERTLLSVAGKLTTAIENARKYRSAQRLAGIDPLTGALNTRAMFHQLDAELARARRLQTALCVLECAIDGIDDSQPELVPRVTRQLADTLRQCCREYDSVARSGDNFVLLLPGLAPSDFEEKRSQLQIAVEEVGFRIGLPLSAAIGAAFFPLDASDGEGLLAAAAEGLRLVRRQYPGTTDG